MNTFVVRPVRRAFTLVELLVVCGVIGTLVALMLPTIQTARESARRTQCQSQLRQWGLALTSHEHIRGRYPVGFSAKSPTGTFVPSVLAFIEQGSIGYDMTANWDDAKNRRAVQTRLALMCCPSSPTRFRVDQSLVTFLPSAGDYVSTHGVNAQYCMLVGWPLYDPPDQNGILAQTPCRAAEVTDGLSQTLLLVEDAGRPELWKMGRRIDGWANNPAWADPYYEVALDGSDRLPTGGGQGAGACVMNCTNDNEAYSFHTGGCNLLFADCGVRFVSDRISNRVFAAITTRASGDFVAGDAY